MALIVPVLANGLRAFGTIYAAHLTSVEAATGFDHIVYGWVFFGLVMAAVLAIGWHWFDRAPDDPVIDPDNFQTAPSHVTSVTRAAGATLAAALLFVGWAMAVERRADAMPLNFALPDVPGWNKAPLSTTGAWAPNYPGADRFELGRYVDDSGNAVDLAVAVYAAQHDGKELIAFGQGAIRQNDTWVRISDLPDLDGGKALRMTAPGPVERQVVTWYRVGDMTTSSPRAAKLATVRTKLLGGRQRAVAILMSAEGRSNPRAAIARFRASIGDIGAFADRLATGTR
jgi:EpsI family protein